MIKSYFIIRFFEIENIRLTILYIEANDDVSGYIRDGLQIWYHQVLYAPPNLKYIFDIKTPRYTLRNTALKKKKY